MSLKAVTQANESSPFLTTRELSRRWRVSSMFVNRLRAEGRLRTYRIGKRGVRFAFEDVLRLERESAV